IVKKPEMAASQKTIFANFKVDPLVGSLPEETSIALQNVHLRPICASNGKVWIWRIRSYKWPRCDEAGVQKNRRLRFLLHCLLTSGPNPARSGLTAYYKEMDDAAY